MEQSLTIEDEITRRKGRRLWGVLLFTANIFSAAFDYRSMHYWSLAIDIFFTILGFVMALVASIEIDRLDDLRDNKQKNIDNIL